MLGDALFNAVSHAEIRVRSLEMPSQQSLRGVSAGVGAAVGAAMALWSSFVLPGKERLMMLSGGCALPVVLVVIHATSRGDAKDEEAIRDVSKGLFVGFMLFAAALVYAPWLLSAGSLVAALEVAAVLAMAAYVMRRSSAPRPPAS